MKASQVAAGAFAVGAGLLLYGALFETTKLTLERRRLRLPGWPEEKKGFRVGVLADLHIRDRETVEMTQRAIQTLLSENPDVIVIVGDVIAYWKRDLLDKVREAMAGLADFKKPIFAVFGNHDYFAGDPNWLRIAMEPLGVRFLVNEVADQDGVNWVGVDSAIGGKCDPFTPLSQLDWNKPTVYLWHEPDMVDVLPRGPQLMVSGHSHGGQFTTPWGWAPAKTSLGKRYVRGFYSRSSVPIYVSRGIATTGPPSRLFCRPEVTVLTLEPAEA
jgi:hypothetical protein